MFGIKRRFQRCKVWPPRFKESSIRAHQIWVPPWKVRFLLLSTNLVQEWLQIDTDLLRIITSTADELSVGTNIDDLERPWTPKIEVLVNFSLFQATAFTERVNFRRNCWRSTRQPAYEIILMLWRVSWALAQISCPLCSSPPAVLFSAPLASLAPRSEPLLPRTDEDVGAVCHGLSPDARIC